MILKAGRVAHLAPAELNEEEKEEYLGKLNDKDAQVDRFRELTQDKTMFPVPEGEEPEKGLEYAWISKIVGDQ
jgi:hypothetical protein